MKKIDFPYNKGAIVRPPFEPGNHGRVHNYVWTLRRVLSADAVLLIGWADAKVAAGDGKEGWVPRVDDIKEVFGWDDKQWRRVRNVLEKAGCITSEHEREKKGSVWQKSVHTLNLDLTVLQILVSQELKESPAKFGGSRARSSKRGGSREPPELGGLRESPGLAALTKTSQPRQKNHDQKRAAAAARGGDDEPGLSGRCALSPAGDGVGSQLANLLTAEQRTRVDNASRGATVKQVEWAVAAVRLAVANGTARSVPAFAHRIATLAAQGQVGAPAPDRALVAGLQPSVWQLRAIHAGSWVEHPKGVLVVEPGALTFRHRGGDRDGQFIGGQAGLSVWAKIDSGELKLQPPPQ